MLQLVTVHRLLGVRPLPAGAANSKREKQGDGDERQWKLDLCRLGMTSLKVKVGATAAAGVSKVSENELIFN